MRCTFCGAEYDDRLSTCPYCGTPKAMRSPDLSGTQPYGGGMNATSQVASEGQKTMEKTTSNMANPRFQKAAKLFGGTVDALIKGGPHMAAAHLAMEGLSRILQIFAPLIELISSPLEVFTSILEMALVPTIQALAPLIADFNVMLIENKDSIIAVVQVMSPLFMGLKMFTVLIVENKEAIMDVTKELGLLIRELGSLANDLLEDEDVVYVLKMSVKGLGVVLGGVASMIHVTVDALKFLKKAMKDIGELAIFISSISICGITGGIGGGDEGLIPDDVPFIGPLLDQPSVVTKPGVYRVGPQAVPEVFSPMKDLSGGNTNLIEYTLDQLLDEMKFLNTQIQRANRRKPF